MKREGGAGRGQRQVESAKEGHIARNARARCETCGSSLFRAMRLEGIHHITAITGDAPRNVDFYTRVMGLRLVAKTVNQDDPSVYHLFYADEHGRPGSELTFFEYPGAIPGRAGRRHGPHDRLARRRRRGARLLGAAPARRGRRRPRATTARCGSPTSRASATSWPCAPTPTSRWPPSTPRSRPSTRSRASTACAPTAIDPERSGALLEKVLVAPSPPATARGSCAASAAAARSPTTRRRTEPGRQSAGTRPPRRLGHDRRRAPATGWSSCSPTGVPNSGDHRPPLLPLDLLPRAQRRAVRDRRRRARLHGRRARSSSSARSSSCRRGSSRTARRSRRRLTPLPDPRAGWPATR